MKTKRIAPLTLWSDEKPERGLRNAVNSASDISPAAIMKSRCLIAPETTDVTVDTGR